MKIDSLINLNLQDYKTHILEELHQENINHLFDSGNVIFIVPGYRTPELKRRRKLFFEGNNALEKKDLIIESIDNLFLSLSVSFIPKQKFGIHTGFFEHNGVYHVPMVSSWSLTKYLAIFFVFYELFKHRKSYRNILFWNFLPHTAIPAFLAKILFGKKIYVDFEDDYRFKKGSFTEKLVTALVAGYIDGGQLAAEEMLTTLPVDRRYTVLNSFGDLSYTKKLRIKEYDKLKIIYSGAHDEIRGADLIVPFYNKLLSLNIPVEIHITGYGVFSEQFKALNNGIDFIYHGYLPSIELEKLLTECHVGLVFQKPDHPFNMGSYPSKVYTYSKYKLICLTLKTCQDLQSSKNKRDI